MPRLTLNEFVSFYLLGGRDALVTCRGRVVGQDPHGRYEVLSGDGGRIIARVWWDSYRGAWVGTPS